jgi:magnesium-transporting ATPase (P-type)
MLTEPGSPASGPRPIPTQREPPWHKLSAAEVRTRLETSDRGLSEAEATSRLARYGPNSLTPARRRGWVRRLLAHLDNVLIYVLLIAGVVTAGLGHMVDSGVIFGVVVINALIGFLQEGKAERALEAVRGLLSPQATVLREGRRRSIGAEGLVPGDLVSLQSGDRVPADLRLTDARELHIDESMLTGESLAVSKGTAPVRAEAPLGDRTGMAYSGTLVNYGRGTGVVVATGDRTEIGRISALLAQVQTLTTPLLRQLDAFGGRLTGVILIAAAATGLYGVLVHGYALDAMFLAAVGLAVAAIPEGLPAIITITLAIGVQRMAARNAIIRRLPAVETLGSVSVICSDKTGTLTRNEMTVQTLALAGGRIRVSGSGYDPHGGFARDGRDLPPGEEPRLLALLRAGTLCNDAALVYRDGSWELDGDPTEGALIVAGVKAGLDPERLAEELPRTDVIPFESEHQFMATLHHDHLGHGFVYLKGAPEAVLQRCADEARPDGLAPLDSALWHAELHALGGEGQRTLAVAAKPAEAEQRVLNFDDVADGFTLLGLVGITDPPREEAIAAVARCTAAGVRVKMITGDHAVTARAIAERMRIGRGRPAITGAQIEALSDAELARRVLDADVFARAAPEHKLRLVQALQSHDLVVAMTGDGVNDAPALKRADVGVAMGIKGTEAAKEAAEMVLADDNFASIAHAVEEGRTVYDNIRKTILFILPTNGGEALTIVAAVALGLMLPVTAAQILWVNMITAVTLALALAFEPAETDMMHRRPRDPGEPILSGFMLWRILFVSGLMVAGTFGLFLWERLAGADIETARTVAVNTLVVAEACYLLNSRFLYAPALSRAGLAGSRIVLFALVTVMAFQLLFTYAPFMQHFFHSAAIDADAWLRILAVGIALFLIVEAEKAALRARQRRSADR